MSTSQPVRRDHVPTRTRLSSQIREEGKEKICGSKNRIQEVVEEKDEEEEGNLDDTDKMTWTTVTEIWSDELK